MKLVVALLAGASYSLGFAPFHFWPVTLIAVAAIYWALRDNDRPVFLMWVFGIGKYGVGASWIYVSIHVYGNASPALAAALVGLFVGFVAALFCAPIGLLYKKLRTTETGPLQNVLLFAAAWGLLDWVLTWLLTGFPWLYVADVLVGLAGAAGPEALIAPAGLIPIIGVLGTSLFMVAASASAVELALSRASRVKRGLLGALVGLPWVIGVVAMQVEWVKPASSHTVTLVQGNLDQARKWLPEERIPNLRRHLRLSEPHWGSELIVWPEAAITFYPQQAEQLLEDLGRRANDSGSALIVGIPGVREVEGGYTFENLAIGLGQARGRFAKQHLVPFGEYVPLEGLLRGVIDFFDLPMSSSSPGSAQQANLRAPFGEVAMAICYEVAYADSMRLRARTAAVLATISNDTWFGESIGPHQHMQIAQARALENGRWMLRATNNGVTAVVDHRGQIQARLNQFEADALVDEFQIMQGLTPYNRWGNLPFLLLLSGVFIGCFWQRFQKQNNA